MRHEQGGAMTSTDVPVDEGFLAVRAAGGNSVHCTAIIGVALLGDEQVPQSLLGDAAAQVMLALSVSTTTFVGPSRLARTAIFAAGLALCGVRRSARRAGAD
jgi:hypothetical protein